MSRMVLYPSVSISNGKLISIEELSGKRVGDAKLTVDSSISRREV